MPRRRWSRPSKPPLAIQLLLATLAVVAGVALQRSGVGRRSWRDVDDWIVYAFAGLILAGLYAAILLGSRRKGPPA